MGIEKPDEVMPMPSDQFSFDEHVACCTRGLQVDVDRLTSRFSLSVEGGTPNVELQAYPNPQAVVEYALWGEAGLISLRAKLPGSGAESRTFPVKMRFSLSHNLGDEVENKKVRIEEMLDAEVELFWNVSPAGLRDHVELTLFFTYVPDANQFCEYAACVLGIITGKALAA
jgi:hypothetical protein